MLQTRPGTLLSVTRLLPAHIDTFWPHVADGVHRSCVKSGGQLSAGWLWQECRKGDAFLYIIHEGEAVHGASIFAFREWPSGLRYVGLALCGRNAKVWFETLHEKVKEDARLGGAVAVVDAARPGMKNYYRSKAIKTIQIVYEERL